MKCFALRTSLCAVAFLLAGCTGGFSLSDIGIESKKIDYKTAGKAKVPTLEVPPDLTSPARDDRYAVPDSVGKGTATFSAYSQERTPQAMAQQQSNILPQVDKTRIDRAGNQRWLVVSGVRPADLWDQVKEFWQETGFIIKVEIPEAGVMETDWAENRATINQDPLRNILGKAFDGMFSTAERDKFRTRLEPGVEPGTTDIFISHRGMYETYVNEGKDQTKWQPREADPELEAEMLRRLMVRFGADQKRAQEQLAVAKSKPVDRAKLARSGDGAGTLELQESFDRAWRRVGLALDRVGFTVEDRDRSKGLYFVRYVDPEAGDATKDKGFMDKLAFWKGPPPDTKTRYRIFVKDSGALTTVQVLSNEGGVDQSETAKKILGLLFNQLK